MPARRVLTVTDLTLAIRDHLETEFHSSVGRRRAVQLPGVEHRPPVLHAEGRSRRRSAASCSGSALRYLRFKPDDGLRVVARGKISVYEPKGEYQIVCEHLEPQGLGALQLAFEQLKKRLQAEGLFDAARKRPLPALPRKIGIVTSLDGAAHARHHQGARAAAIANAQVVIRPARVQGDGAAARNRARPFRRSPACPAWTSSSSAAAAGRSRISGPSTRRSSRARSRDRRCRSFLPSATRPTSRSPTSSPIFARRRRRPPPKSSSPRRTSSAHGSIDSAGGSARPPAARVQALEPPRPRARAARPALAGIPRRLAMRGRDVRGAHACARAADACWCSLAATRTLVQMRRQLDTFDLGRRLGGVRTRLVGADGAARGGDATGVATVPRRGSATAPAVSRRSARWPCSAADTRSCWNADRTRVLRDAADVQPGDQVHGDARRRASSTATSRQHAGEDFDMSDTSIKDFEAAIAELEASSRSSRKAICRSSSRSRCTSAASSSRASVTPASRRPSGASRS